MAETADVTVDPKPGRQRDRSPSFPFISLRATIDRLVAFDKYFGRHPASAMKAGLAWNMRERSSQAYQTLAALKAFCLIDYEGSGDDRVATLTGDARTFLRTQQDEIKIHVLKRLATKPKQIGKFWGVWGADRPPDPICLDDLVIKHKYTEDGAATFLKVYDDTIAYAGLSNSDKIPEEDMIGGETNEETPNSLGEYRTPVENPPFVDRSKGFAMREGERVLSDGILSQTASYRVVVSGKIGPKEIDRLIKKLEMDKEILADSMEQDDDL